MKTCKHLIILGALSFFGILGAATVIATYTLPVKTETPKIETASNTHYLMPTIFPQVKW
jgi:hypothetical protein